MDPSKAYDTLISATYTIIGRVIGAGYYDPSAPNVDLQMAARLSAITDAQTKPVKRSRANAGQLAKQIKAEDLRLVLSRRNGGPNPVGEFSEEQAKQVITAINTIANLAS
tara:strand:- start:226 stop:555 length:330 start_codon:yes stop_codon:yes gene_type:complete